MSNVLTVSPAKASERLRTASTAPTYLKMLIYGDPGAGKALALDTLIPTPRGFKHMGDITVGDVVYDGKGRLTLVTNVSQIYYGHQCYEVCFDDGSSVVADAEHLWKVRIHLHEITAGIFGVASLDSVVTTKELSAHINSIDMHPFSGTHRSLPIPPYALGFWIGSRPQRESEATSPDAWRIRDLCAGAGYSSTTHQHLWDCKRIPQEYLFSALEQRLLLMQGLVDAGCCTPKRSGSFEIVVADKQLAHDIATLLAGLGVKNTLATEHPGVECVRFTANQPVARLPNTTRRYVKSVQEVPSVPVKCIAVASPEHTYMCTDRFIVTHNTWLACTAPNPILVLTDYQVAMPTLNALRRTRGIDPPAFFVDTLSDFEEAYMYIAAHADKYQTVIVDSLSDLNDRITDAVLKGAISAKPAHDPDQLEVQDWLKVGNRLMHWIRLYRDLPMHTVCTALAVENRNELLTAPMIHPHKTQKKVPAFFNLVGYLSCEQKPNRPSARRLFVDSTRTYIAKNPGNALPAVVDNPDLATLLPQVVAYLSKGVADAAEESIA